MNAVRNGLLAVTFFVAVPLSAQMRDWTNHAGKTIQAEMVASDSETVSLKLPDGTVSKVALTILSPRDREYVAAALNGDDGNFLLPWPKEGKAPDDYDISIVKEEQGEYIYETPHFRFISDAKLNKSLVKKLSEMFEATYEANKALPLNNLPVRIKDEKFPARLFEQTKTYYDAGGREGTAGFCFYQSQEYPLGLVMVPFEFLGVKPVGTSYMYDAQKSSTTLRHEITHQMTPVKYHKQMWYSEGTAEYMALSPYRNGRINLSANKNSILQRVTSYDKRTNRGRNLGKRILAPSLKQYMGYTQDEFYRKDVSNLNYGLSPLIVYYFFHADGNGDAKRIKDYLKALEHETADQAMELLLDGRTYDQLAKEISTFWRRSGIVIDFAPSE